MSTFRPLRKIKQYIFDKPYKQGEVLNHRYRIEKVLGAGSFGLVYRCLDEGDGNIVAVKQLRPSLRRKEKERLFFQHEINILQYLNHPSIPTLIEFFEEKDQLFYAMEYINGENMAITIFEKKQKFTEKEALQFVRPLVDTIGYLHSNDIYHGDLRIPNIMIENNQPVLIDLGLAHCFNEKIIPKIAPKERIEKVDVEMLKQDDYFNLGDLLLFLLYTTYEGKTKKTLPWTEELFLQSGTTYLLRRLLGIDNKYSNVEEIVKDFNEAIKQLRN